LRKAKTDASGFLLAAIILTLAAGIAVAVYTLRSDPAEEALSTDRVINTLFIIEQDKKPLSTYVLMFFPETKRAAIFDIPGEVGLLIAGINRVDRIDTVYTPGRTGNFEREIGKLLGIEINFSVVINTENLGKQVDLLEGVEIFIPSPVDYREGPQLVMFSSGLTVLDGDKARVYATYAIPYEEREMEMFRRQRFFLSLLKRQAEMNENLKNPALAKLYHSFFQTSMKARSRMRLFDEFVYIDFERINIQTVGGNQREVSGEMLLIPYWDGSLVKEIVRQTLGSLTRQSEGYLSDRVLTVEVLNGTAIAGLAGRTAELLRSFGYDVISIGNADRNTYETTEITDRTGNENMAKTFAGIIRCENIRQEDFAAEIPEDELMDIQNYEYRADFTLIIGRDFNGRYVTGN